MNISIIVPVYNRPAEVGELLESLSRQTDSDFEVVIVEDGSTIPCKDICETYADKLRLLYLPKPNGGRSRARNYGMDHASGDYFIIFDSDCIMPPEYVETVKRCLNEEYVDCFGGPDNADAGFSDMQKAINYSMTSFMTTGGIRGATKNKKKFTPRSFNMGISKECYLKVGGFRDTISEDIDLSFRIKEAGFETRLFPEAYVYHKRRVSLKKFYRQVNTFGRGRLVLNKLHPGALKAVHLMPACFVLGNIFLVLMALVFRNPLWLLPLGLYVICLFLESFLKNRSLKIAALSIAASYVQLFGYGLGFLDELLTHRTVGKGQEEMFK